MFFFLFSVQEGVKEQISSRPLRVWMDTELTVLLEEKKKKWWFSSRLLIWLIWCYFVYMKENGLLSCFYVHCLIKEHAKDISGEPVTVLKSSYVDWLLWIVFSKIIYISLVKHIYSISLYSSQAFKQKTKF